MAIVQISQITNRKGLAANLPTPLAGAELGWSTDTRQLWIGNGTLAEGAPVVGNTEILTEFSDIITAVKYTYSGESASGYAAQTGPTAGQPIILTQQEWMDQYASVLDFGAVGDGVVDDTDAINRALYQIYCVDPDNVPTRRSLFFPAGKYKITESINIPTFATLNGEGPDNTIIMLVPATPGATSYVAQYADSAQQTGSNIATTSGTPPTDIHISNMQFYTSDSTTSVFLVSSATNSTFTNVAFVGGDGNPTTGTNQTTAVNFDTTYQTCSNIKFTDCFFGYVNYAVSTEESLEAILFDKSYFYKLYQGLSLGANGATGPTGTRITNNTFDQIYSSAIIIGTPGSGATLNASSQNIFYDVANSFTSVPGAVIIGLYADNNISIGDMFTRSDTDALVYSRILVDGQNTIAFTNGQQIEMGAYTRKSGLTANVSLGLNQPLFTQNVSVVNGAPSFSVNYSMQQTGTGGYRTGVFSVASLGSGTVTYQDDFVENLPTGITLSATQTGNTVTVKSSVTTTNASMFYSINYLS